MFPTYPLVRFVESPDVDAAVRFDFHDPAYSFTDPLEWQFGTPRLIGGPGGQNATYGLRELSFVLRIAAHQAQALRIQSTLARELLRDGWLLFQLSPTSPPQWFRVLRSDPGEPRLDWIRPEGDGRDVWQVEVDLVAEPFAVGEPRTFTLTIPNTSAGIVETVSDVIGDAPAPMLATVTQAGATGADEIAALHLSVMGVSRWDGLQLWQAEALTTRLGTTTGGGAVYRNTEASWLPIVGGHVTTTQAGRWRLWARMRQNGVGVAVDVRSTGYAAVDPNRWVTMTTDGNASAYQMVDLGVHVFPRGNAPLSDDYVLAPKPGGGGNLPGAFEIEVRKRGGGIVSGATAYVDYIVAVPIDLYETTGPARTITFPQMVTPLQFDGDQESVAVGVDSMFAYDHTPEHGAYPLLYPGQTNVIHTLRGAGGSGYTAIASGTTTTVLEVTYRPRWLYLAAE